MNDTRYRQLIRLVAAGVGVLLWWISIQFSIDGFNFVLPKYQWMGILLGLSVTAIELVWNEEGFGHDLTIVAVGLLSYGYGIMTNILGIWAAQGAPDGSQNLGAMIFPVLLGFFLEVAPEPLFVWGILGSGARDFLGNLFGGGQHKSPARRGRAAQPGVFAE